MADKYNVEAAEILANDALRLTISEAVPIYEQLLATFPTAARYWKQYVEAHMAVNDDDATKQIFSRCLLNCLQIPLWRCYIRYIRKVNEKKGVEGQEETRKAFDFMLSYVGADVASGPVWMEYISFLKSMPAQTTQEESQRMTAVRKAYQKAIVTPTQHAEQLWKDYENFENSVSRTLAKGLLSDYQPKYNSARAVYRERKKYIDEIDWNVLAVPPSGSYKEELQWLAWKRFLAFEKGNPQRIDSASSNKRIVFTYEQCLMYLYHYPDMWYDYATWHAKSGSVDSAIKVFHRALKALPDSEMLKYAYAELEESRGAIQVKQYIRFLRRTEGVEAARKYFVDARKSPNCTYHVYIAYATMAFCLDKDPKIAHNVFEAGLKRYADFLSRLNDDRNIRALFERALSSLPPEESVEVWKRFTQFEQTYGDLASMLKVEQRRKEALSRTEEESQSPLDISLQDVVSRYSFMDLWPCSSKDLDHLTRQEWLSKNINKKVERSTLADGAAVVDKASSGLANNSNSSAKVVYPDTSRMVIYDPRQKSGPSGPGVPAVSSTLTGPSAVAPVAGGTPNAPNEFLKATPPALLAFLASLPTVEGPSPDVDFVLSICLQSNIPTAQIGKSVNPSKQLQTGPAPSTSDLSGSSKPHPVPSGSSFKTARDRQSGKKRDRDGQDDDDTATVQSQPLPRDMFKIRQLQKARGAVARGAVSQTGSTSYGSAFSGELSGSTG
ncbi:hypothetical protein RHGRI_032766 [Rhododendron griersonianum]|uniref:Suppressor of forked domain-containing protein n=1 Tax=Rhododendron griersonianum TaxID=479676 RepID=A0AAV6IDK9_9ERIC|nr:hypothetical protein RHGRI_032766 [Rhododendron griersonianum]